jgi:hypothetical protein
MLTNCRFASGVEPPEEFFDEDSELPAVHGSSNVAAADGSQAPPSDEEDADSESVNADALLPVDDERPAMVKCRPAIKSRSTRTPSLRGGGLR